MLSSIAHEFRNPLNSISGNLDLIATIADSSKILKFASDAKISSTMLNSYVEDILDLGRIEKGGFVLNSTQFKVLSSITPRFKI